ncbi:MAG: hypothetical protein V3V18_05825 [Methylococcales bacterium]
MNKIEYIKHKYILMMMVLLTTLAACSSGPQIYNTDMPVTSQPLVTQELVGTAIMSASRFFEEWNITKVRPGEMKGTVSYGAHVGIVSIPYDANSFRIIYKSSDNFDFDAEDQTIHPRYNAWVKKLEDRINEEIHYHIQLKAQQTEGQ